MTHGLTPTWSSNTWRPHLLSRSAKRLARLVAFTRRISTHRETSSCSQLIDPECSCPCFEVCSYIHHVKHMVSSAFKVRITSNQMMCMQSIRLIITIRDAISITISEDAHVVNLLANWLFLRAANWLVSHICRFTNGQCTSRKQG
jgi:hypothetical protein